MRADRLLSTLLLLQANGKMTVRQLAKRLEVSHRTAYRDLEALSAAGVPVLALRGSRGGWQLDEAWRTQVPGLDDAELRALLMAQPRVIGDAPLAAAAQRALDKLMAAMPVSLRARAAFIRQRLYVDTSGWRGASEDLTFLPIVQDAVSRDRKLAIEYRKPDHQLTERIIDPLGLVAKGMSWYLVANTRDGFRTFRVSRIEKAKLLDIPTDRPPDFDLASYWKTSTEKFRESRRRYSITVRVDPRAAEQFMSWRMAKRVAGDQPDPDGWFTLSVEFDDEEHACFVVQGMGGRAEVLEPVDLRERVFASAKAVIARLT
ncbi:MAG TPA: YafY family protein [Thermoanaerobaculia bacterium]|nr:YafY family protein [Thermoanaerobaculia bacterium]